MGENSFVDEMCSSCSRLSQEMESTKREQAMTLKIIREKIISTDKLIRKYQQKCDDVEEKAKEITELHKKLEASQRNEEVIQAQLDQSLKSAEPLNKNVKRLIQEKFTAEAKIEELRQENYKQENLITELRQLIAGKEEKECSLLLEKQVQAQELQANQKQIDKLTDEIKKTKENLKKEKSMIRQKSRELGVATRKADKNDVDVKTLKEEVKQLRKELRVAGSTTTRKANSKQNSSSENPAIISRQRKKRVTPSSSTKAITTDLAEELLSDVEIARGKSAAVILNEVCSLSLYPVLSPLPPSPLPDLSTVEDQESLSSSSSEGDSHEESGDGESEDSSIGDLGELLELQLQQEEETDVDAQKKLSNEKELDCLNETEEKRAEATKSSDVECELPLVLPEPRTVSDIKDCSVNNKNDMPSEHPSEASSKEAHSESFTGPLLLNSVEKVTRENNNSKINECEIVNTENKKSDVGLASDEDTRMTEHQSWSISSEDGEIPGTESSRKFVFKSEGTTRPAPAKRKRGRPKKGQISVSKDVNLGTTDSDNQLSDRAIDSKAFSLPTMAPNTDLNDNRISMVNASTSDNRKNVDGKFCDIQMAEGTNLFAKNTYDRVTDKRVLDFKSTRTIQPPSAKRKRGRPKKRKTVSKEVISTEETTGTDSDTRLSDHEFENKESSSPNVATSKGMDLNDSRISVDEGVTSDASGQTVDKHLKLIKRHSPRSDVKEGSQRHSDVVKGKTTESLPVTSKTESPSPRRRSVCLTGSPQETPVHMTRSKAKSLGVTPTLGKSSTPQRSAEFITNTPKNGRKRKSVESQLCDKDTYMARDDNLKCDDEKDNPKVCAGRESKSSDGPKSTNKPQQLATPFNSRTSQHSKSTPLRRLAVYSELKAPINRKTQVCSKSRAFDKSQNNSELSTIDLTLQEETFPVLDLAIFSDDSTKSSPTDENIPTVKSGKNESTLHESPSEDNSDTGVFQSKNASSKAAGPTNSLEKELVELDSKEEKTLGSVENLAQCLPYDSKVSVVSTLKRSDIEAEKPHSLSVLQSKENIADLKDFQEIDVPMPAVNLRPVTSPVDRSSNSVDNEHDLNVDYPVGHSKGATEVSLAVNSTPVPSLKDVVESSSSSVANAAVVESKHLEYQEMDVSRNVLLATSIKGTAEDTVDLAPSIPLNDTLNGSSNSINIKDNTFHSKDKKMEVLRRLPASLQPATSIKGTSEDTPFTVDLVPNETLKDTVDGSSDTIVNTDSSFNVEASIAPPTAPLTNAVDGSTKSTDTVTDSEGGSSQNENELFGTSQCTEERSLKSLEMTVCEEGDSSILRTSAELSGVTQSLGFSDPGRILSIIDMDTNQSCVRPRVIETDVESNSLSHESKESTKSEFIASFYDAMPSISVVVNDEDSLFTELQPVLSPLPPSPIPGPLSCTMDCLPSPSHLAPPSFVHPLLQTTEKVEGNAKRALKSETNTDSPSKKIKSEHKVEGTQSAQCSDVPLSDLVANPDSPNKPKIKTKKRKTLTTRPAYLTEKSYARKIIKRLYEAPNQTPIETDDIVKRLSDTRALSHGLPFALAVRDFPYEEDFMPVIIKTYSERAREVSGTTGTPLMPEYERRIADLIDLVRPFPHLQMIPSTTINLLSIIVPGAGGSMVDKRVLASKIRLVTALCRLENNISHVRVLAYKILLSIHISTGTKIYLMIAIAGVWPAAFSSPSPPWAVKNGTLRLTGPPYHPLAVTTQAVITKWARENNWVLLGNILDWLCGWTPLPLQSPLKQLTNQLAFLLVDPTLASLASDKDGHPILDFGIFEVIKSLELVAFVQGWEWINNTLIREVVWDVLKKWKTEKQSSCQLRDIVQPSESESDAGLVKDIALLPQDRKQSKKPPLQGKKKPSDQVNVTMETYEAAVVGAVRLLGLVSRLTIEQGQPEIPHVIGLLISLVCKENNICFSVPYAIQLAAVYSLVEVSPWQPKQISNVLADWKNAQEGQRVLPPSLATTVECLKCSIGS